MASRHFSFKTGKAGSGGKHSAYLAGDGKYAERDDVRYVSDHNIPSWAKDGREFFSAADENERANGRSYSEVEFAIPRGVADPVGYAKQYADQLLGDRHPYRLAVHDKLAGDGGRNIHGHLMFTERQLDGYDRSRERFFKRANKAHPERGGTAKNRGWNDRQTIQTLRRDYEKHAKAHGIELDLRSNLAQGLTRPEPKIGPDKQRRDPDQYREARKAEVENIRSNRKAIAQVKAELSTTEKEHRNEHIKQRRRQHRERNHAAGRTTLRDVRGIDALQAERNPEHLLQRDERHHVEQRRLADEQAARRVHELATERKRVQWRDKLTDRREAWKACAVKPLAAESSNKRKVFAWGAGPAANRPAFYDYGDRLKPAGNPDKVSDAKIRAMLVHAESKGWQEVTFTGPQEFRERCAAAAVKRGLKLADADLAKRFAPKIEKPVPKSYYHPDNVAKREAQALQESQQKAAEAEQRQAQIKKLNEQRKTMEYTKRLEADLQAGNAKAAAELRDKADLLAEQVASGEKSPAVLKTANEHVRNAELLERIAAEPLNRPAAPALDSIQGNDIQLADHFEKLIGWIRSTGGEHQKIPGDGAKSEWEGRFVKVDDQFAVQNVGKKHVIHILSDLDKKPLEGSKGNVLYGFDGKAKVTIQPDLTPVKGKGGIAD